jgi:hypothetical protein
LIDSSNELANKSINDQGDGAVVGGAPTVKARYPRDGGSENLQKDSDEAKRYIGQTTEELGATTTQQALESNASQHARVLIEIKTYLVMAQTQGKKTILQEIEAYTRSFGDA